MKRREYTVSQDGKVLVTKNAWNTARRAIRDLVRARMKPGEEAVLFSYAFKRDEQNLAFVKGSEIWHVNDGKTCLTLVFQIQQVI